MNEQEPDEHAVGVVVQMQPAALRAPVAASYVGVSLSKFHELVSAGQMPKPIKIGRASLWRRQDLDASLDQFADESAPSQWDEGDGAA